jgi:hypothetical protein
MLGVSSGEYGLVAKDASGLPLNFYCGTDIKEIRTNRSAVGGRRGKRDARFLTPLFSACYDKTEIDNDYHLHHK